MSISPQPELQHEQLLLLFRSRNLGVGHPGCRHVCIEAGRPRQWHAKLEQEQLRRPVEAILRIFLAKMPPATEDL
jgi:hypothetical protein